MAQILIVEDEIVIADDIQDCLENLGYRVPGIAATGAEAILKAEELRPDLVLMDIRLRGDMDGIQAADQIWRRCQIPIVYSTGYSDPDTLRRAKSTAPFGYVLKPAEERELYVAIETALQRYQLDRDLQEREQWLTTILKGIGDGVIVFDAQGAVRFLNPVAEALTGWSHEDAIGKAVTDVFYIIHEHTRAPIENPVTEALQTGIMSHLTANTLLVARDGSTSPIDDSAAPLVDDKGTITGAVVVFRDVTQRRLAEEQNRVLLQTQQLLTEFQQLNQLKDDFLSTVSHELRTPLTNIKMAIQMLEIVLNQHGLLALEGNATSRQLIRYLEILRNQCDQELSLVNDLLDLQRLNADTYLLDLTTIQLQVWLPEQVEIFVERAKSRQQQIQIVIPSDLPAIACDLPGLTRIFAELLNNACKYTPPGERITVTVQATNHASMVLTVCNSGVEIPLAELSRIFDQFYRIPSSDRWNQGGTGLGLTLVQKLVTHMGGSIQAQSGGGQTCFMVELPIRLGNIN